MRIDYSIEFFSYWHCGSGLAAGADVDELAIKDGERASLCAWAHREGSAPRRR